MPRIGGIHHVTAICGDPQENLDFYAGVLGMRLVKRSVNQDDPTTYHLFYADAEGHPGSDITFFPWPGGRPGRHGAGQTGEVAFAVPAGSLAYWQDRLAEHDVEIDGPEQRFGDPVITFTDPHGLELAIVATEVPETRPFTAWEASPVPAEHQIRGFHSVRVIEQRIDPTLDLVTDVMGFEEVASQDGWTRYQGRDPWCGTLELKGDPSAANGIGGVGTVHHVAWRVADRDEQEALQQAVARHGSRPTQVIDRFWFTSVYFREPGGVLFELATDGPGFTVDEPLESLGERLVLPPWMEDDRATIEEALPELELPYPTRQPAEGPEQEA